MNIMFEKYELKNYSLSPCHVEHFRCQRTLDVKVQCARAVEARTDIDFQEPGLQF